MRVIPKTQVQEFLAVDLLAQMHTYKGKISSLEKKYKCSFKEFEKKIKRSKKEVFEEWDDYIDWKGFTRVLENLDKKIKDIKRGNFKVA
jgi:hypothetical protein